MNGRVLGSTKILDNGPDDQRANLVLVSEGYLREELGDFRKRCNEFVRVIKSESWYRRVGSETLNVHRVDVISDETAAWLRFTCPGNKVRSFFSAQFCGNNKLARLMSGDAELVLDVVRGLVPKFASAGVLVNSKHRGGAGTKGVFWSTTGEGWTELALHEMGHSLFLLADEYDGEKGTYTDVSEPCEKNITIETNREKIKWRSLIADSTRIPTRTVDEGLRQERVRRDEVGLFEGAKRFSRGIYRGANQCRMRDFDGAFCPVCEEAIVERLSALTRAENPAGGAPGNPHPTGASPAEPLVRSGRISIAIGGRTVEFEDSKTGTFKAIEYLTSRVRD